MNKRLLSQKIAILAANGFNEREFLAIQRALIDQGAIVRIVSTDSGLVNGWEGAGWGHNFAIDAALNTALGIDYSALVIPGGHRSLDKLKLTAHSKRFIGSFLAAMKPVICMGDAIQLLAMTDHLAGRRVSGPEAKQPVVETAGAIWSADQVCVDQMLVTGDVEGEKLVEFIMASIDVMGQNAHNLKQAA